MPEAEVGDGAVQVAICCGRLSDVMVRSFENGIYIKVPRDGFVDNTIFVKDKFRIRSGNNHVRPRTRIPNRRWGFNRAAILANDIITIKLKPSPPLRRAI